MLCSSLPRQCSLVSGDNFVNCVLHSHPSTPLHNARSTRHVSSAVPPPATFAAGPPRSASATPPHKMQNARRSTLSGGARWVGPGWIRHASCPGSLVEPKAHCACWEKAPGGCNERSRLWILNVTSMVSCLFRLQYKECIVGDSTRTCTAAPSGGTCRCSSPRYCNADTGWHCLVSGHRRGVLNFM